jgi:hypothetical protein
MLLTHLIQFRHVHRDKRRWGNYAGLKVVGFSLQSL